MLIASLSDKGNEYLIAEAVTDVNSGMTNANGLGKTITLRHCL